MNGNKNDDTHIKTNTTFQLKDLNTDYEAEEEVEEEKNKDTDNNDTENKENRLEKE